MGAAFDADLYRSVGAAIGLEARGLINQGVSNGLFVMTPNVNLIRDPRPVNVLQNTVFQIERRCIAYDRSYGPESLIPAQCSAIS